MITLAIVLPCYNEEKILIESTEKLRKLLISLMEKEKISLNSFFLYVNDGSTDSSWEIIENLHQKNEFVKGINLAKNSGHQNAIMAGMMFAKDISDAVITIDADLQDDLNAIEKMIDEHNKGYEIIYGVKTSRKADPILKRLSAISFYKIQALMGINCIYNHADFRFMSKKALNMLAEYQERNLYLRALIPQIGLKSTTVDDVINKRTAGNSKYTLTKMLELCFDGITSFTVKPVRFLFIMGLIMIFISIIELIYVIYTYFSGNTVPGWASIILSIWFTSGCILTGLGIIGEYIGKLYIEAKKRPRYNIESILF